MKVSLNILEKLIICVIIITYKGETDENTRPNFQRI